MRTLNWKSTDWLAKDFIFTIEQQVVGQLTFDSYWDLNALYTDKETKLSFAQKSFWDKDILITKDEETIGEVHTGLFGEQISQLASGEKFILSTSLWEQEVYWKTDKGEIIIKYQQALMSSMGKGLISSDESLTNDLENLLISTGVFVRRLARKRKVRIMAVLLPVFAAAASRL